MEQPLDMDLIFSPSEDIVAREIEGELVLVPLVAGMGDNDDELYTLNETGKEIWRRLDGKRSLRSVAEELAGEYESQDGDISEDVAGLIGELLRRKMVVSANSIN